MIHENNIRLNGTVKTHIKGVTISMRVADIPAYVVKDYVNDRMKEVAQEILKPAVQG